MRWDVIAIKTLTHVGEKNICAISFTVETTSRDIQQALNLARETIRHQLGGLDRVDITELKEITDDENTEEEVAEEES